MLQIQVSTPKVLREFTIHRSTSSHACHVFRVGAGAVADVAGKRDVLAEGNYEYT